MPGGNGTGPPRAADRAQEEVPAEVAEALAGKQVTMPIQFDSDRPRYQPEGQPDTSGGDS